MAGMERIKVAKMKMALIPAAAKKKRDTVSMYMKRPSKRISYQSTGSDPTAGFEQHWKWLG